MTDLTEAQRALLLEAATAPDDAIDTPADPKPVKLLIKRGLFISMPVAGGVSRLMLTDAGRQAVGAPADDDDQGADGGQANDSGPPPAAPVASKPAPAGRPRKPKATEPTGKLSALVEMLKRPEGASVADMMAATGWQAHSVRGAMSGSLKKAFGLTIDSTKTEAGRVYRIVTGEVA